MPRQLKKHMKVKKTKISNLFCLVIQNCLSIDLLEHEEGTMHNEHWFVNATQTTESYFRQEKYFYTFLSLL